MALPSIAGLAPAAAHQAVLTALKNYAAPLAVCTAHPPDVTRSASAIGGAVNLCNTCSVDSSKVGWPCWPYRKAATGYVTGLPS